MSDDEPDATGAPFRFALPGSFAFKTYMARRFCLPPGPSFWNRRDRRQKCLQLRIIPKTFQLKCASPPGVVSAWTIVEGY